MTITYGIVCETYMFGDDIRIAYGIAVFTDTEINGTVSIIKSVHDISPDKEKVGFGQLYYTTKAATGLSFSDIPVVSVFCGGLLSATGPCCI